MVRTLTLKVQITSLCRNNQKFENEQSLRSNNYYTCKSKEHITDNINVHLGIASAFISNIKQHSGA